MQLLSSCLQQLVESPTFKKRVRRPKTLKTTLPKSVTSASHRPNYLGPDADGETTSLLVSSRSNAPSVFSAATTTGIIHSSSLTTKTPSLLSAVSFAKSENHLPVLPLHVEPSPHKLDFSADAFKLSEYVVDKEAALSRTAVLMGSLPEPPRLTEPGRSNTSAPTAYYSVPEHPNSPPFPSSSCSGPSNSSSVPEKKDEHEDYLEKLRLLRFGDTETVGDGFLSEAQFSISVVDEDDDTASWEEIDLLKYGWQ